MKINFPASSFALLLTIASPNGSVAVSSNNFKSLRGGQVNYFDQDLFPSDRDLASDDGYFELRSVADPDFCLDIPKFNTNNGINLIMWNCYGNPNQLWKLDSNGYLRSKLDPTKCIDPEGPSTENWTNIQIWDCESNYIPQKWTIDEKTGYITSQWDSSKCIDVRGYVAKQGAEVHLHECHGGSNQRWIVKYPPPASTYTKIESGTCEDAGLAIIDNPDTCLSAATEMGHNIVWGPYGGYEDVVDGCSIRFGNNLFANPAGTCDPDHRVGEWTYTGCECTDWMPCFCQTSAYVSCGWNGKCEYEEPGYRPVDEMHEVRCCSETALPFFVKNQGCSVYGGSKLDGVCYHAETYGGAKQLCEDVGARLCTRDEIENNCTKNTGCMHDLDLVWTSD